MSTNQEMLKMQQDAIRRVREMHARAKRSIEGNIQTKQNKNFKNKEVSKSNSDVSTTCQYNIYEKSTCDSTAKNKECTKERRKNNNSPRIFDILLKDEERSLILILLILLMGEEDSLYIMFALLYLLL